MDQDPGVSNDFPFKAKIVLWPLFRLDGLLQGDTSLVSLRGVDAKWINLHVRPYLKLFTQQRDFRKRQNFI